MLDEQLLLQADPPVAVLVVAPAAVVDVLDAPPAVEVLALVELALLEPPADPVELALVELALLELALVEPAVVDEVVEPEPVDDEVEAAPFGGSQKM